MFTRCVGLMDGSTYARRRRRVALVSAIGLAFILSLMPLIASGADTNSVPLKLHKHWVRWAFGESGAPLLRPHFCGEQVGSDFYLTVAGGAPTSVRRVLDCDVPSGVSILVTPGGSISWAPSDGRTANQLHEDLFRALSRLLVGSVRLTLDGDPIDAGPLVAPDPYSLHLEPGNLIQTVDPAVKGSSTRIAEAWYFALISPLASGDHVLVAADTYDYTASGGGIVTYRTRFKLHVA